VKSAKRIMKLRSRIHALEARVDALEQAQRWTSDVVVNSEPVDAQALLRGVAEEYGRCYEMWGDDECRAGVYI
jgi:hypothetical protein